MAKRGKLLKGDYSIFSSYLGRSATLIVFSFIVLLALGALLLDREDMAHMHISIGVFAFDSVTAAPALESLADFMREKGSGDIEWIYFDADVEPSGCDLYLMRALQLSRYLNRGRLECCSVATVAAGRRYGRGVVVIRAGAGKVALDGRNVIFTSANSAVGFISPYLALREAGMMQEPPPTVNFSGDFPKDERVALGVLYGAYRAGGMSFERFRYLEKRGLLREGELEVFMLGDAMPEIILAADVSAGRRELKSFAKGLAAISNRMPRRLREDLLALGMAGFAPASDEDREIISKLQAFGVSAPSAVARPDGGIQ